MWRRCEETIARVVRSRTFGESDLRIVASHGFIMGECAQSTPQGRAGSSRSI